MEKRWVGFFFCLAALLAVMLSGCGGGENSSENAIENSGEGNAKVVILGSAKTLPEEEAAWEEVCEDFTAETGIEVEQRWQGKWEDMPQRLQSVKLAEEQADLIVVGMGTVSATLGPAGNVMDLTDLMADLTDRFPEGVLDSCMLGDHLWAIPYSDATGTTCFYNRTMFESYGLDVPTNLDEWLHCAEVFSADGIIPFMVHGKDAWSWAMPFFETYGQTTDGESVAAVESWLRGEKTFGDEKVYEALDALKLLYDNGILTSESFDTDESGMLANFAQGNCAMIFCGTWDYRSLKSMELEFDFAACEFPTIIEGAKPCHAFATGDGAIAIPSWMNQSNLENTMRFVEYLLRPENAKKILCAQAGGNPTFEIVKGAVGEKDEVIAFLNEVLVPNSIQYLDWIWPTEVNDSICNVIPSVISGAMTAEEAADYVQGTLDTLVSEEEYVYDWWNAWTEEQWNMVIPKNVPDLTQFMTE